MTPPTLLDLALMPNVDHRTQGLTSVSEGSVVLVRGKPSCVNHGAMNCVRPDGLWRCQHAVAGVPEGPVINLCGNAAYAPADESGTVNLVGGA